MTNELWPPLPLADWEPTRATLHMWTQIVGKVRLATTPIVNHWWNVPLYVTARGLTTSAMPYEGRTFSIDFDFIDHALVVACSDGGTSRAPLEPMSVAEFHRLVKRLLGEIDVVVAIWQVPVEVSDPIPFPEDTIHASYDAEAVSRFWRILTQVDRVFASFRARFTGKCSPVHFFWGSFDLAVTRFSGRPAPPRPDADAITRFSYNAELISLGFWPGGGDVDGAAFYSYTFPEPDGFRTQHVLPPEARYHESLGLYLLMYDTVRASDDPEKLILDFAQSTYEAGARLQGWAVDELEIRPQVPSADAGAV
jgi:hypothetical protein